MVKKWEINGTEEIGIATPTPGPITQKLWEIEGYGAPGSMPN